MIIYIFVLVLVHILVLYFLLFPKSLCSCVELTFTFKLNKLNGVGALNNITCIVVIPMYFYRRTKLTLMYCISYRSVYSPKILGCSLVAKVAYVYGNSCTGTGWIGI